MRTFLKHFFLIATVYYIGVLLLSEDVKYELPSAIMFFITFLGFILTATSKGKRKVRV